MRDHKRSYNCNGGTTNGSAIGRDQKLSCNCQGTTNGGVAGREGPQIEM